MKKQKFHLGDVLSVTTGRLVSPTHIDGVYKILNFMTRDDLFTHQLPRAGDECKPYLAKQFPQLSPPAIDADIAEMDRRFEGVTDRNKYKEIVDVWLAELVEKYGENFEVEEIPLDDHVTKDPLGEMMEMVDPKKIIVMEVDE
jgi:hypothetical protein